tara:strand:- start:1059 stop:1514 length:456 start_codon:yes stop_codon:yes gene_type:complete
MKINFTKKEYPLLLEMITMANWMLHSRCIDEDSRQKEHDTLRNKILSHYKEFAAEDLVEAGEEPDEYYESNKLMDHVHRNFISSYDEETFWDELTDRLAMRDVVRTLGEDQYVALDGIDRITKVEDAKKPYSNEFERHGLENVIIKLSTEK